MKYLESAKSAIQEGEPENAIILLREYLTKVKRESNKTVEDLILIGSRCSTLKTSRTREIIPYDVEVQELNKINMSLIEIISELETKHEEGKGIFGKPILMNMPRAAVSDVMYYAFTAFGLVVGLCFLYAFFTSFYQYISQDISSIKKLLFIGSMGILASCFLMGAYESMNRRKGMLVNWKIVGPHIIIAVVMILSAAILSLL